MGTHLEMVQVILEQNAGISDGLHGADKDEGHAPLRNNNWQLLQLA
jgi:hypothetical protein